MVEGVRRGQPSLLHRRGREARPPDDVAGCVDVLDARAEVGAHRDVAARVGGEARLLEVEIGGLPLPPGRVEHDLGWDALPALEARHRRPLVALDRRHCLAEPEDDPHVAQVVLEPFGDLRVDEVEEPRALLDDGYLQAERREHRRVLDADDAGTDDEHRRRDVVEEEQTVGVEDRLVVELDGARAVRARSRGDDDLLGAQPPVLGAAAQDDGVRVDEAGGAGDDVNAIPRELVADDVDLALDDLPRPQRKILDRDLLLDAVALAVHGALTEPGEVHDRFAESLRRDRPAIDRDAPELATLDDGDAPAELGRLDGRLLASGPRADDQELVVEAVVHGSKLLRAGKD
jgi:hypothetical protein